MFTFPGLLSRFLTVSAPAAAPAAQPSYQASNVDPKELFAALTGTPVRHNQPYFETTLRTLSLRTDGEGLQYKMHLSSKSEDGQPGVFAASIEAARSGTKQFKPLISLHGEIINGKVYGEACSEVKSAPGAYLTSPISAEHLEQFRKARQAAGFKAFT